MALPTFILIGVAKAGTRSIHAYAAQHPDVFMAPMKETNYFAAYGRRPEYRGPGDRSTINRETIWSREEYEKVFDAARLEHARGEASGRYMLEPAVPPRIATDIPSCRIVVGLRNPVDRAHAAWSFARMSGRERLSFDDALRAEPGRRTAGWARADYARRGFYADQLARYYDCFGRESIHVYLFEDLIADPGAVMRRIFSFIDVDEGYPVDTSSVENRSGLMPNKLTRRAWEASSALRNLTRTMIPKALRERAYQRLTSNVVKPEIGAEARDRLLQTYREDIERTQALVGRDLSGWLRS